MVDGKLFEEAGIVREWKGYMVPEELDEKDTIPAEVFYKAKEGDEKARDRVVRKYMKMVFNEALRYSNPSSPNFRDVVQEGMIGLLIALDKYDPSRGFKFSTYATYWIRHRMRLFLLHDTTIVSGMVTKNKTTRKLLNHFNELSEEEQQKVLDSLEEGKVEPIENFDLPVHVNQDSDVQINVLRSGLGEISPIARKVIKMRYGFWDGKPYPATVVAKVLRLSPDKVRRMEKEALRKLAV